MFPNGYADSAEMSVLAEILDDYCTEAGLDARHPARLFLARRLLSFHASGEADEAELCAALNVALEDYDAKPFSSEVLESQTSAAWASHLNAALIGTNRRIRGFS